MRIEIRDDENNTLAVCDGYIWTGTISILPEAFRVMASALRHYAENKAHNDTSK